MKQHKGNENYIHAEEKETYDIKNRNDYFLQTPDKLRYQLHDFYKAVIGNHAYAEERVPDLHDVIINLRTLLDWAWLEHDKMQKRLPSGTVNAGVDPKRPSFIDYSIDSYYPRLQASKWPTERRERFDGNVLLLSQEDVYWEDAFFEQIFQRKSMRVWKELLDTWVAFALDSQQNIIEIGKSTAYDALEDYECLQKLIEIAWLSIKQDNSLCHDHLPWFDIHNYPVFITMENGVNPYDELYGFFHWKSLPQRKREINKWIKAVLDNKLIWQGIPSDLVCLFKQIGLLVECAWLIKELGPNYPKRWNSMTTERSTKRAAEPNEKYKYSLPVATMSKPENYLIDFFNEYSMEYSFHYLFECLWAALGHDDTDPFDENDIKRFHENLIKLIEATFLIQKLKFSYKSNG